MRGIAFQLRDEIANLVHALGVEPAMGNPAADGEAVGAGLARADELMAAFVVVDVELDRRRETSQPVGVDNQIARIRAAPAVELGVDYRWPRAAAHRATVQRHLTLSNRLSALLVGDILLESWTGDRRRSHLVRLKARQSRPFRAAAQTAAAKKDTGQQAGKRSM